MASGSSQATLPNTELGIKDLSALYEALYPVRAKYKFFGLQIGVDINEIKGIETNYKHSEHCLLEVLSARLKQEPALTCADIDKALKSRTVKEHQLAKDFRSNFECKSIFNQQKDKIEESSKAAKSKESYKMSEKESERIKITEYVESESESDNIHKVDKQQDKQLSPECDMTKNQYEGEMKELVNIFERFFGKLCCAVFDPKDVAAELQSVGLISRSMMREMIVSPESQQAKIIALVDELDRKIKSCPDHLFVIIKVMLKKETLQETATEILRQAGRKYFKVHALQCFRKQNFVPRS